MTFSNFQININAPESIKATYHDNIKIQEEVKYLRNVYYDVYQHFLSAIDLLGYYPSMHPTNTSFETPNETNTNYQI